MVDVVSISTNPVVLRNRGFRIKVCCLAEVKVAEGQPKKFDRIYDPDSEPITEDMWFKFTNATLAEIELPEPFGFGSVETWGDEMERRPFMTLARTFAVAVERYRIDDQGQTVPDWKYGSLMMLDGEFSTYTSVMMGALQIAQGADPNRIGEKTTKAIREAKDQIRKSSEEDDDAEGTQTSPSDDSPSQPGSPDGQSSEETSTSSGD